MMTLTLILANIKTVLIALASLIGIGFLANYARRGKKVEAQKQEIQALKAKAEVAGKVIAADKAANVEKEKIAHAEKSELGDSLNHLPK